MSLVIQYKELKHFDVSKNVFDRDDQSKAIDQADTGGWALMGIGINKITDDNVWDCVLRMKLLDTAHRSTFIKKLVGEDRVALTTKELKELIQDHVGLEINYGKELTNHRFLVRVAKVLEENVEHKLLKDLD